MESNHLILDYETSTRPHEYHQQTLVRSDRSWENGLTSLLVLSPIGIRRSKKAHEAGPELYIPLSYSGSIWEVRSSLVHGMGS